MTQISRKWISDNAIDHTKVDGSDSYTVRGLVVTTDATISGGLSLGGPLDLSGATISNISVTDATVSNNLKTGKIHALTDTIIFYGDATVVPTNGTEITFGGLGGSKSKIGADSGYLRVSSGDAKIDLNDSDSTYVEIYGKEIILNAEAAIINGDATIINLGGRSLSFHTYNGDDPNSFRMLVDSGNIRLDTPTTNLQLGSGSYTNTVYLNGESINLVGDATISNLGGRSLYFHTYNGDDPKSFRMLVDSGNIRLDTPTTNLQLGSADYTNTIYLNGEAISLFGDATFTNVGGRSLSFHTISVDDPKSFRMLVDSGNIRLDTPTTSLLLGSGDYTHSVYLNGESISLSGDATITPTDAPPIFFRRLTSDMARIGVDTDNIRVAGNQAKIDLFGGLGDATVEIAADAQSIQIIGGGTSAGAQIYCNTHINNGNTLFLDSGSTLNLNSDSTFTVNGSDAIDATNVVIGGVTLYFKKGVLYNVT